MKELLIVQAIENQLIGIILSVLPFEEGKVISGNGNTVFVFERPEIGFQ